MSPPIGGVRAGYLSAGKDAIPDSEVDQFEYGGPVTNRYNGETGNFGINQNSPVFEGSYSLKCDTLANEAMVSYTGDGLNAYPTRGDWIQGQVQPDSSGCRCGVIAYSESGTTSNNINGYLFEAAVNSSVFRIRDEGNTLASGGTPSIGQAYTLNIYSNSSELQAEWVDQSNGNTAASLSVSSETNHDGSGFGFRKRERSVFDDFRILKGYGLP